MRAATLEKEKAVHHDGHRLNSTTTVRASGRAVKVEKGELADSHAPSVIIVSTVARARATATSDAHVSEILRSIRSGKWRHQIEPIRTAYARAVAEGRDPKSAVDNLKKALPAVLWSGQFTTRQKGVPLAQRLLHHSGILCADLDHIAG